MTYVKATIKRPVSRTSRVNEIINKIPFVDIRSLLQYLIICLMCRFLSLWRRPFFITSIYTRFKSIIYNHQVRQVFCTWDLNQQEFVQRNWECEQQCSWQSTSFEQMLVGWDEIHLQNEKFNWSLYNYLMRNKTK